MTYRWYDRWIDAHLRLARWITAATWLTAVTLWIITGILGSQ